MQTINIQFPDKNDLLELLKEAKLSIAEEKGDETKDFKTIEDVTILTRHEVASLYRISLPTLHKHTCNGLPSLKIGKRRLYRSDEVKKYFEKRE